MEIRQVRPEEYAEAGRVTALAYQEFAPPGDADWEAYLRVIADVAGRVDRTIVLVAVEDSKILGSATIEMDGTVGDDDVQLPSDVAALRMLGVDPAARGRGVGHALVQATIDRCRGRRKRELILRTTERHEHVTGDVLTRGSGRPGRRQQPTGCQLVERRDAHPQQACGHRLGNQLPHQSLERLLDRVDR